MSILLKSSYHINSVPKPCMTVKEFIQVLQALDQEMPIGFTWEGTDNVFTSEEVLQDLEIDTSTYTVPIYQINAERH